MWIDIKTQYLKAVSPVVQQKVREVAGAQDTDSREREEMPGGGAHMH